MDQNYIEGFRISPEQKHLWQLSQEVPDSSPYRISCNVQIKGPLQHVSLQRALQQVVDQHEILRTSFRHMPGLALPVQVIHEATQVHFNFYDLTYLLQDAQHHAVTNTISHFLQLPYNFSEASLLKSALLSLSNFNHLLVLSLPALCGDATTLKNMVCELAQIYETYVERTQNTPIIDEVMQYADLTEWQYEILEEADHASHQQYWISLHSLLVQPLFLSEAQRHTGQPVFNFQIWSQAIAKQTLEKLSTHIQQHNYTLELLLLTVWSILLKRLSTQANFITYISRDMRDKYDDITSALGPLTKVLPLSISLPDRSNFNEAVKTLYAAQQIATDQQEYFSWDLFTASSEGSIRSTQFPSFCFELIEVPEPYLSADLSWQITHLDACIDRFVLKFTWLQQQGAATLVCTYDSQMFSNVDVELLIERYLHLLNEAVQNPTLSIDELSIVPEAERQHLIVDSNQTYREHPKDICTHQLFEQQVANTPELIAVRWGDETLTYKELDMRAQTLAHHLQTVGVGPEVRVGIFMQRSLSLLVAILGVMKAGGVYVPLDPAYPKDRLTFIAVNAAISICLTQDALIEKLLEIPSCHIISDTVWATSVPSLPEFRAVEVLPKNLAYVLYTSGSTGQPKGVMVTHQGLANYMFWSLRNYYNTRGAGSPVHSSISFDLTVTSLFAPLLAGQCVEMVPEGRGIEDLLHVLQSKDTFSVVKLTPAHLDLLSHYLSPAEVAHTTKLLIIGGEQLYYEQLAFWHTHAPHVRLINEYGPTETVVGCVIYEVPAARSMASGNVPIGRPIDNTQLYVLDSYLHPVPVNVPGQLYIGGDGLARGYLNAPDLTAERFLPNPFSSQPGVRFYCTGDRVRLLADGNLEFLGRVDHQVKVRGFRIELAEIEATLLTHPMVHEAVVVVREEHPGDQRLVAYVVLSAMHKITIEELQHFISEKLPEYMIPSSWRVLEELPLNAHGKVDRQALPAPLVSTGLSENDASHGGPRSFIEEVLMDIWKHLLHIENIGPHDNFFSLGGHSILAAQVISRIRDALHVEVPVRLQFEAPTIADMAKYVETLHFQQQDLHYPPLQHREKMDLAPLTYAQERLWYVYLLEPDSSRFNNFLFFRLQGTIHEDALIQSLQALVERHDALRTTFTMVDGQPMQMVAPEGKLAFERRDLRHLPQEERNPALLQILRQDRQHPIDLRRGPLLRAVVVYIDEQEYGLLLATHHIIYDGWSRGILYRELSELYAASISGRQPVLPTLSIHYLDFAFWQRQWLQDKVLKTQLEYWRKHLEGAPPLLTLPWDRPRPAVQTFQAVKRQFILSRDLSIALREYSHRAGVTLFMTLMASFKVLLYRYSGQEDMVVAFPIANRDRTELEGVFGLFSDVLLLRTHFSGKTSFYELLRLVHKKMIEAYTNHDVPFMKIFEALSVKRNLSYNPLFQVLFEFLLMPEQELKLPALSVKRVDLENLTLDLDLYLSMSEESDGSLRGLLAYNADLFESTTIDRMLRHFEVLLGSIVENPDAEVAQLPLMAPEEREMLIAAHPKKKILEQIKSHFNNLSVSGDKK